MQQIFNKYATGKGPVGIGTGKTMEEFASYLPSNMTCVPTSTQTVLFLGQRPLCAAISIESMDVYFDSADYYSSSGLIKGGGGALTQEKLFARMARHTVIIVQQEKYAESFTGLRVPIEILAPSYGYIRRMLRARGLGHSLRMANDVMPLRTDFGNIIIDVEYDDEFLEGCKLITGVVEHGYFEKDEKMSIVEI